MNDSVRGLVEIWRKEAAGWGDGKGCMAAAFGRCASDLERALGEQTPNEGVVALAVEMLHPPLVLATDDATEVARWYDSRVRNLYALLVAAAPPSDESLECAATNKVGHEHSLACLDKPVAAGGAKGWADMTLAEFEAEGIAAGQDAAPVEPVGEREDGRGTSECPICSVNTPHSHSDFEKKLARNPRGGWRRLGKQEQEAAVIGRHEWYAVRPYRSLTGEWVEDARVVRYHEIGAYENSNLVRGHGNVTHWVIIPIAHTLRSSPEGAVAWYVERIAPGYLDHGTKFGLTWIRADAERSVDQHHVLRPLFARPEISEEMVRRFIAKSRELTPGLEEPTEEAVVVLRAALQAAWGSRG